MADFAIGEKSGQREVAKFLRDQSQFLAARAKLIGAPRDAGKIQAAANGRIPDAGLQVPARAMVPTIRGQAEKSHHICGA